MTKSYTELQLELSYDSQEKHKIVFIDTQVDRLLFLLGSQFDWSTKVQDCHLPRRGHDEPDTVAHKGPCSMAAGVMNPF